MEELLEEVREKLAKLPMLQPKLSTDKETEQYVLLKYIVEAVLWREVILDCFKKVKPSSHEEAINKLVRYFEENLNLGKNEIKPLLQGSAVPSDIPHNPFVTQTTLLDSFCKCSALTQKRAVFHLANKYQINYLDVYSYDVFKGMANKSLRQDAFNPRFKLYSKNRLDKQTGSLCCILRRNTELATSEEYLHAISIKEGVDVVTIPFQIIKLPDYKLDLFLHIPFLEAYPIKYSNLNRGDDFVVLTDFLFFKESPTIDLPMVSWYGGVDTVEKIDWSFLKGKRVIYPLINHSGNSKLDTLSLALRVREILSRYYGCDVTFLGNWCALVINEVNWGKNWAVVSFDILKKRFAEFVETKRECDPFRLDLISHNLNKGLQPMVVPRGLTMITGYHKAGKSLVVRMLAEICTGNKKHLNHHTFEGRGNNRVFMIIGDDSKGEQFRDNYHLLDGWDHYNNAEKGSRGIFLFARKREFDISNIDVQKQVEEYLWQEKESGRVVDILVMDNIPFLKKVKNDKYWKRISDWLYKLNSLGYAIILSPSCSTEELNKIGRLTQLPADVEIFVRKRKPIQRGNFALCMHFDHFGIDPSLTAPLNLEFEIKGNGIIEAIDKTGQGLPKDENVEAVRRMTLAGHGTEKEIAKVLGISQSGVNKIKEELGFTQKRK